MKMIILPKEMSRMVSLLQSTISLSLVTEILNDINEFRADKDYTISILGQEYWNR